MPESRLVPAHRTRKATISREMAKTSPLRGEINPVTSGRFFVRSIRASISRSMYMLMAFAPPAARVPPTIVTTISHRLGQPLLATTMVGIVVMRSSSIMRGFVRAMYPATTEVGILADSWPPRRVMRDGTKGRTFIGTVTHRMGGRQQRLFTSRMNL